VSEPVVQAALLGIREDRVGFGRLFEFFLCRLVARVAVRMVPERELAVGTLDFLLGGGSPYLEHVVVIA
jgi:hypothetical protein